MIKISNISKNKAQLFFIGIFLSFLTISFRHSHHYNFQSIKEITETPSSNNADGIYFDDELNCIIHFLSNSLFNENTINDLERHFLQEEKNYSNLIFTKSLQKKEYQSKLRGPPNNIT